MERGGDGVESYSSLVVLYSRLSMRVNTEHAHIRAQIGGGCAKNTLNGCTLQYFVADAAQIVFL